MSLTLRNNLHPLHFHQVHGENISLSKNRTVACRSEGFCKGIVFSDRHILINEHVFVKFLEVSPNWSGALRIGFTMNDPLSMKSKLPRYACPDLTSMHGNWAKAVGEKLAQKDSILYFYVDENGDVHYGIGAEEYGIFFGGVNVSGKLWAVLDIYGNTIAVEFIDPVSLNQDYQNDSHSNSSISHAKEKQNPILDTNSFSFHTVCGKNVTLKQNGSLMCRKPGLHSFAYAFTEQPLEIGKTILMKVFQTDHYVKGPLTYGITSCDPSHIDPGELPENAEDLFDRLEYWVVKHKIYSFEIGDAIKFTITSQGRVEMLINEVPEPVFYVDKSQPLWLFVNLSGAISELKLVGILSNISSGEEFNEAFSNMKTRESGTAEVKPGPSGQQSASECVICYEEVDCVVYRCGHMCMCYKCALTLFSPGTKSQCPICRNPISDIIKIYK